MYKLINFINLNQEEKQLVLNWRNHPKIRRWMKNTKEISINEHLKFLETLTSKKNKTYFLVKQDSKYLGVISLVENCLGIYANPNEKKVGDSLLNQIISYAFHTKKLTFLIAEVFEDNSKAIKLYERNNFKIKTKNNQMLIMELKNENRQI